MIWGFHPDLSLHVYAAETVQWLDHECKCDNHPNAMAEKNSIRIELDGLMSYGEVCVVSIVCLL